MHNKRDDAWAAFSGKVYNITPYLAFHPGGEKELMRVAGRDGTKLFGMWHSYRLGHPVPTYTRTYACMGERGFYARCLFGRIFGSGAIILIRID